MLQLKKKAVRQRTGKSPQATRMPWGAEGWPLPPFEAQLEETVLIKEHLN